MPKNYFVTGIDTNIGKTIASAILVEALNADYWKPIQAGDIDNSDTQTVENLISNKESVFHPERYALKTPASPHLSASIDGVNININDFVLPKTQNNLIVEGAGGLLVPINNQYTILDLIKHLKLEVILVSKNYLGSINHTLLSIYALQKENIPIKGLIFNGEKNNDTQEIIINKTKAEYLGNIPHTDEISKNFISENAQILSQKLS